MFAKNLKQDNIQSTALNLIGTGTAIAGDITSDGDMRIDGKIDGNVTSKSKLALGSGAEIKGNVNARSADVSGKIIGDLEVSETLFLRATAQINGNLKVGKLIIESGASFNGNCYMNQSNSTNL